MWLLSVVEIDKLLPVVETGDWLGWEGCVGGGGGGGFRGGGRGVGWRVDYGGHLETRGDIRNTDCCCVIKCFICCVW